jgi:hypothetical protein
MQAAQKYDLLVRSTIIRSEKPTKGLDAVEAPNQHQMNRVTGYLPDGTQIIVAQRPGKGGMDFNKLLGGKVYAVAADGMSPVYEKGEDGKPTKVQKKEDGLPLYSSSGFYLLSSKEYPALDMLECFTLLQEHGQRVLMLTPEQVAARQRFTLTSDLDLEILQGSFEEALSDERNFVARFDEAMNKKRKRGIERAQQEAEDADEKYEGVAFKECAVSKKDGNPFIYYTWKGADGAVRSGTILREALVNGDKMPIMEYYSATEALAHFTESKAYKELFAALEAGQEIEFSFAQGHVMRTSVSFRRKCENVLAAGKDKPLFGDAVYIHAALMGWTRGLISVMHSLHPNFPSADYDSHSYVAACRQAEIGMNKKADGKWTPPQGVPYDMAKALFA